MLADTLPLGLSSRAAVSLSEVLAEAPQLHRVDRKYLVDIATVTAMVEALPASYGVLTIAGRQGTTYRSTYFDTDDLATCRAHLQRRRRRWKVRSRLYVEDDLCRVEVKSTDGSGLTDKTVANSHPSRYASLDGQEAEFVSASLAARGLPADVSLLRPTAEVTYHRATLADTTEDRCRVTLDWQVQGFLGGRTVRIDDGYVLVETKGGHRAGRADQLLVSLGARPRAFSKYVATASLLRDDLPDNDVRRMRGRQLHTGTLDEQRISA